MVALAKSPRHLQLDSSDCCEMSGGTVTTDEETTCTTTEEGTSPYSYCGSFPKSPSSGDNNDVALAPESAISTRDGDDDEETSSDVDDSSVVLDPILLTTDDPKQFFAELQQLREARRRGILTVRCTRESCCSKISEQLKESSRARRSERYMKRGMSIDDVKVRFSTLQIREHSMLVGDNPGGLSGPPITIAWDHHNELTVNVDDYESSRPQRRDHAEMQMPASYRMDLLKRCGFSRNQIIELTRPVNVTRAQRARTRDNLQLDTVNELVEKLTRKAKHVFTFGATKRKERKLLEPYLLMSKLTNRHNGKGERSTSPARSAASGETTSMEFTEPEMSSTNLAL